jgi:hypothetical protein
MASGRKTHTEEEARTTSWDMNHNIAIEGRMFEENGNNASKKQMIIATDISILLLPCVQNKGNHQNEQTMTTLELTQEWDKVITLSEKVSHRNVTFNTQYGWTLAADLYEPREALGKAADFFNKNLSSTHSQK